MRAVSDLGVRRLPKGRHSLTRQQVADAQRLRLAVGLAEAMREKGYVGTPVAEILKRAGVSRETFYQLYDDKLACFLDALDLVGAVLAHQMGAALGRRTGPGDPLERAERAIDAYLAAIAENPAFARLYLVEVHAAGPEAMKRRAELQASLVDGLAKLLGARTEAARFACQAYIAAIASLVTLPIVTGDLDALHALRRPLVTHLRALVDDGPIGRR
jgi:AcrR family transcriptional regulator